MNGVAPFGGPIKGSTPVKLSISDLEQKNICDLKVRLSTYELTPSRLNSDQVEITAP
jgi:hypothetical protein